MKILKLQIAITFEDEHMDLKYTSKHKPRSNHNQSNENNDSFL